MLAISDLLIDAGVAFVLSLGLGFIIIGILELIKSTASNDYSDEDDD